MLHWQTTQLSKATHLNSNVIVRVTGCCIEKDGKQRENRSFDEEHTFRPYNHYCQNSHQYCHHSQWPRSDAAFPVPFCSTMSVNISASTNKSQLETHTSLSLQLLLLQRNYN